MNDAPRPACVPAGHIEPLVPAPPEGDRREPVARNTGPIPTELIEPTPTELVHQLHEALYGERSPARDAAPKQVWHELLAEVRRLTHLINPEGGA